MSVLVTVGSTHFDNLVETCVSLDVQKVLVEAGYTELRIQSGQSKATKSTQISDSPFQAIPGLCIDVFEYAPTLADEFERARLVITHAGAGSILECLSLEHPPNLIVVPNETLMDNHQLELAEQLDREQYCIIAKASPSDLARAIKQVAVYDFRKFSTARTGGQKFAQVVREEMKKIG